MGGPWAPYRWNNGCAIFCIENMIFSDGYLATFGKIVSYYQNEVVYKKLVPKILIFGRVASNFLWSRYFWVEIRTMQYIGFHADMEIKMCCLAAYLPEII